MSNRYLLALTWNAPLACCTVECCVLMAQLVIWIFIRLKGQLADWLATTSNSLSSPLLSLSLFYFYWSTVVAFERFFFLSSLPPFLLLLLLPVPLIILTLSHSFTQFVASLSLFLFFLLLLLLLLLLASSSLSLSQLCYLIKCCLHYDEI